jgi:peptidyl-prolyl cis-trans isomerase D
MLAQFRNLTRGAVAAVLLGLIALSMILFLPQGSVQLGSRQDLVRVGNLTITPAQLDREIDGALMRMRQQGVNMSQQEAVDQGGHLQLLQDMITSRALNAYADKLGVSASDAQVGAFVRRFPAIQNPITGQVDETAYRRLLAERNYTEPEFLADVRGDLTSRMLMQSLVSGTRAPSSFGAINLAFESETRVISIAEGTAASIGAIPQPNDAQIQAFYEDNQDNLRIPEFRSVTLVHARPADFMARVEVPEARLREEFDARAAAMTQPERRTYVRLTAQNEQQANQAAQRLGRGEDVDTVAQDMQMQAARGEDQTRDAVTDARVAEAVFAMAPRSAPRVVRGELSPWVVVRLEAVTPAVTPNFAEARDELRTEIARDEAGEMLSAAVSAFEEARDGGASVADAARQANLPTTTIAAMDEHGHDRADAEIPGVTGNTDLIGTAFRTAEGESSDFLPAEDGDVLVAVDRIVPTSVRPLAEVRADLVQAWISNERVRRLRELGTEVVQAVAGGQDFVAAARERRMNVVARSQRVDRRAAAQQIPARGLGSMIFGARVGQAVSDIRVDGGAILVAAVEDITRIDPAEQPQLLEASRSAAQERLVASVIESIRDETVAWAKPNRNEALIASRYRPSNAEGEEEEAQ